MAKHSVPKKKQSKTRSGRRYKTFVNETRIRLANAIQLVPCVQCGEMRRAHHVCTTCGKYKGRVVINKEKEIAKVTKIQA